MKVHYELIEDLKFWIINNTNSPADTRERVIYFKKMLNYLYTRQAR